MSDLEPEIETALAGLGWRTYEDAFGDRADLARSAASSIGAHGSRAHTRGDLLSPSLIDLIRRELGRQERSFVGKPVLDARGQVGKVAAEAQADGSTHLQVSVRFDVGGDDEAATRIAILLEALGFEAERVSLTSSLTWRIDALARRFHLTQHERRVLEMIVADRNNAQVAAELGLTRKTVKWHIHNLLGKTKASTRHGLIRMLLGPAASDRPSDDAVVVDLMPGEASSTE